MSQRQLALQSGVDHSTISRLIKGDRMPSLGTATKLARGLREIHDETDGPAYFASLNARAVLPTTRVEYALRGDDSLTEADVRELMQAYIALRARRSRGIRTGRTTGRTVLERLLARSANAEALTRSTGEQRAEPELRGHLPAPRVILRESRPLSASQPRVDPRHGCSAPRAGLWPSAPSPRTMAERLATMAVAAPSASTVGLSETPSAEGSAARWHRPRAATRGAG